MGKRLSKRQRNVSCRDDYVYFHHYSFQICITDLSVRSIWLDIWPNSFSWLVMPLDFVLSVATRPHVLKLRLRLIFKLMRGRLEANPAFCLPRRSRGKWKKNDANIQLSWPAWSIKDLVTVLSSYRGFYSQRPVFILLLFSILRVGRQPMQDTDLSRFFKAKRYHGSLRDTIAHLLQTHLRRLGTRRII